MKFSNIDSKAFFKFSFYLISWTFFYLGNQAYANNPNGDFGSAYTWTQQDTSDFNQCFKQYGSNLNMPEDKGEYCSSAQSPQDLYLDVFVSLSYYESHWNPEAQGHNGDKIPAGLFQMDSDDMINHHCSGTNPMVSKDNICCAVKIASDDLEKNKLDKLSTDSATSHDGIMDAFWQPMRDGTGGNGIGKEETYTDTAGNSFKYGGAGNVTIDNTAVHNNLKTLAQQICSAGPQNYANQSGGNYSGRTYVGGVH